MSDAIWPIATALCIAALAWVVRDIAIRILAHRAAEQRHNEQLKQEFADKMSKVGSELLKQLRDEIDATHKLVQDTCNWVITREGGKQPANLPTHITSALEDRTRRRAAAQGRNV